MQCTQGLGSHCDIDKMLMDTEHNLGDTLVGMGKIRNTQQSLDHIRTHRFDWSAQGSSMSIFREEIQKHKTLN